MSTCVINTEAVASYTNIGQVLWSCNKTICYAKPTEASYMHHAHTIIPHMKWYELLFSWYVFLIFHAQTGVQQ